ncbi:MAG: carboxypeptidase regulatory-like domain-containing protein [Acidobacteria bacterium]|nr:carboxypeptidase regulatory-like domain-containing protein [Acidobacteriota bacterium]
MRGNGGKANSGIAAAALFIVGTLNHAAPLLAQNSVSGSLRGFVRDIADGAPVPKAVVEARNNTTGARWSTVTFKDGSYTIPLLSSGEYTIRCRHRDYEEDAYGPVYVSLVRTTTIKVPPFLLHRIRAARPPGAARLVMPLWQRPGGDLHSGLVPFSLAAMPRIPGRYGGGMPAPQANTTSVPQMSSHRSGSDVAQIVNTENALRGGDFDERYLSSLPLPGIRTFDSLAFLVAGVEDAPQATSDVTGPGIGAGVGTPGQFSVNGMRARANNFTLDGSDNNDQDVAVRRQGFLSLLPQSVDSVQEFHISTLLWDAELGRNLGAQVNAITKSGTNRFYGQVYGFLTDSRFNARNFFDCAGGAAAGKEPYTRTQAGLIFGGPLARDRAQLLGSFEYQSIHASQEQHFASPAAAERRFMGLPKFKVITSPISLNNHFDYETAAGATPLGLNLLSIYPLPNNATGPYGANTYSQIQPAGGRGYVGSVKLSHQIVARHALDSRYNFADDSRDLPGVRKAINSAIQSATRSQNLSLILNSGVTDTLFNQARISFGRTRLRFAELPGNPLSLAREDKTLGGKIVPFTKEGEPIPGSLIVNSSTGPLGELTIRPYSPVGLDASLFPQGRINNTMQYADTISRTWLGHTLRFGGDIRFVQFNSRQDRNYRTLIDVNNGILEVRNLDDPFASGTRFLPGIQFADIGQVSSIFQTITAGAPNSYIGLRFREFNLFVNENWRLRPNLNIDFGLRFENNTVPREVNGRIESAIGLEDLPAPGGSQFDDPRAAAAFDNAVDAYRAVLDGRSRIYDPDHNNFSPHAGFAWDPFNNGRMSVRGGYGLYYDTILGAVVSQARNVFPTEIPFLSEATFFGHDGLNANNPGFFGIRNAEGDVPPFFVEGTNQLAGTADDFVALVGTLLDATKEAGGLTFTLPDKRLRTPYVQQWHLTLEREMFTDYLVAASYVGTKGTKLTRPVTPNGGPAVTPKQILTLKAGAAPTVTFDNLDAGIVNQLPIHRQDGALGAYRIFENSARSNYHAFQLETCKRYSHGLTFTGAYTWSHAIDDVSDIIEGAGAPSIAQDSVNLGAERGHAGFDVRHRVAASAIVDLPRFRGKPAVLLAGWQIASIFQARTGQPFTLAVPFDANLDGNLTDRPSTTEGLIFSNRHSVRRVAMMPGYEVTDFYSLGRNGSVGRNTVRGDGLVNLDLALNKKFRFADTRNLDLRVEVFNVFNRANFGLPVRTIGDPGFGSSTNTVTPARIIQFAVKLRF